jgi:hypothetical protein
MAQDAILDEQNLRRATRDAPSSSDFGPRECE